MNHWSWALSAVGVLSLWAAGRGSWYGWASGFATQIPWAWYAVATGQYGFVVSSVVYGFVYAKNTRDWYRNRPPRTTGDGDNTIHGRYRRATGTVAGAVARAGVPRVHRVRAAATGNGVRVA